MPAPRRSGGVRTAAASAAVLTQHPIRFCGSAPAVAPPGIRIFGPDGRSLEAIGTTVV
jgi:hypothetical protein